MYNKQSTLDRGSYLSNETCILSVIFWKICGKVKVLFMKANPNVCTANIPVKRRDLVSHLMYFVFTFDWLPYRMSRLLSDILMKMQHCLSKKNYGQLSLHNSQWWTRCLIGTAGWLQCWIHTSEAVSFNSMTGSSLYLKFKCHNSPFVIKVFHP